MILLINTCHEKLHFHEFVKPILNIIKDKKVKVVNYKELKPSDLDVGKIIISGSSLGETNYNLKHFRWIKEFNKPILGICSGMHIIGRIFNEKLKNIKEVGLVNVKTIKDNNLLKGNFEAYSLHSKSVNAPKDFDTLAKSSKCIQSFKHKNKEIYGVLFHPEVRNKEIIERFVGL